MAEKKKAWEEEQKAAADRSSRTASNSPRSSVQPVDDAANQFATQL